jgi:hypothetical protein
MDCEEVRALLVESLLVGHAPADAVARHLAGCDPCRAEADSLAATWAALGALPLQEPSAPVARRLRRRLRWEATREVLRSGRRWQEAALAGVLGFLASVLLGLVLPYEVVIAACRAVVPEAVSPLAYLLGGFLYGLLPMALGVAVQARRQAVPTLLGALEAPLVFLVVAVPYVVVRCAEFPPALLAGFAGGIAIGAVVGGGAGARIGRRPAWA